MPEIAPNRHAVFEMMMPRLDAALSRRENLVWFGSVRFSPVQSGSVQSSLPCSCLVRKGLVFWFYQGCMIKPNPDKPQRYSALLIGLIYLFIVPAVALGLFSSAPEIPEWIMGWSEFPLSHKN